ncbi:MoxR family ATPase [Thioalkalivibrio sp. XN279]|uniref:AAA family ATPase n=1 Tax=Thioalkalivibrio sp. XN279 TaxID=2714953 RepID=UPI0014098127|nr:AAA family ATPase [Thioalkalivibrio sp. XN279]NHA14798.1 AAA domain-containing protein [Thioalkalivibrio sp. XN279]
MPGEQAAADLEQLRQALQLLEGVILGKENQLRLCISCLLAGGHLLIEDVPGVGKTTLAHGLAHALGLSCHRIQFTSDLLPADIVGVSVYQRDSGRFSFHPGPVFAQLVLADEVNRATPKAQSALLEAMEERQVTVDGVSHPLPEPFFVVATQNPAEQVGTFPLPESQLDRFLMRIRLGYPERALERELLRGEDRRALLRRLPAAAAPAALLRLREEVSRVHASEALLDYVQALVAWSREHPGYGAGLSPRAAIALLRAARAWALLDGRHAVIPEDVQAVTPAVVGHRLRTEGESTGDDPGERLVAAVPIP